MLRSENEVKYCEFSKKTIKTKIFKSQHIEEKIKYVKIIKIIQILSNTIAHDIYLVWQVIWMFRSIWLD